MQPGTGTAQAVPIPPPRDPLQKEAMDLMGSLKEQMQNKAQSQSTEILILDELKKQTLILGNLYTLMYALAKRMGGV